MIKKFKIFEEIGFGAGSGNGMGHIMAPGVCFSPGSVWQSSGYTHIRENREDILSEIDPYGEEEWDEETDNTIHKFHRVGDIIILEDGRRARVIDISRNGFCIVRII